VGVAGRGALIVMKARWLVALCLALLRRPTLWPVAARQICRLAAHGWWRRPPFMPLPDHLYAEFRSLTQYGDPGYEPEIGDVLVWLEWCRKTERGA